MNMSLYDYIFISLISIISFASCKSRSQSRIVNDIRSEQLEDKSKEVLKTVEIAEDYSPVVEKSLFKIKSVQTRKDTLVIRLKYKSGCNETFTLKSNGIYMKSLPPQINVYLEHTSTQPCEINSEGVLKFMIDKLRDKRYNEVVINVNSFAHKANYSY